MSTFLCLCPSTFLDLLNISRLQNYYLNLVELFYIAIDFYFEKTVTPPVISGLSVCVDVNDNCVMRHRKGEASSA